MDSFWRRIDNLTGCYCAVLCRFFCRVILLLDFFLLDLLLLFDFLGFWLLKLLHKLFHRLLHGCNLILSSFLSLLDSFDLFFNRILHGSLILFSVILHLFGESVIHTLVLSLQSFALILNLMDAVDHNSHSAFPFILSIPIWRQHLVGIMHEMNVFQLILASVPHK